MVARRQIFYSRVAECIRNAFRPRRSKEIVGPSPTSGTNFVALSFNGEDVRFLPEQCRFDSDGGFQVLGLSSKGTGLGFPKPAITVRSRVDPPVYGLLV